MYQIKSNLLSLQDVMQQATNAILRGGTIMTPSVSAKTIAEQLAEKINAKLNYTPVEKLEEERQAAEQAETVKRYEEELEINDFPQVSSTQRRAVIFDCHLCLFTVLGFFLKAERLCLGSKYFRNSALCVCECFFPS